MNERYKTIILCALYTLALVCITAFALFVNKDTFILILSIFVYMLLHVVVLGLACASVWMFYWYLKEKYTTFLGISLALALIFILLSWVLVQADMGFIGV